MEIPKCESTEHCWHASTSGADKSSQRCCHCGLDLSFEAAPYEKDRQHGYHGKRRTMQAYQLIADTAYRDMYKKDPSIFHKLDAALEKGREAAASARRHLQGTRIFPRTPRFKK